MGPFEVRILQFCTDFPERGGIQTHVLELSDWLRKRGHEVMLAGQPGVSANADSCSGFIELPMWKIAVSRRTNRLPTRILGLLSAARTLRRRLRSRPVDLVHVHETAPALTAWLATRGMRIPIIMTYHGSAPERVREVARVASRVATLTLSPSRTSLDDLTAAGLDPARTRQAGLGIKPLPEVDAQEVRDLRRLYLGETDGPLIFSPSRLAHQKGIDIMIEVARQITKEFPDAVFVVAGAGPLDGQVQQWARDAGVERNMRFVGSVSTVPVHLAACDLMLLTSRWENLPISIAEAFRAGKPVVATDCGGVKELVDDSVGALCPVGDVTALTSAISELLRSDEIRRKKGLAALARSAEDRFDPDTVHADFERIYSEVLGEPA